MERIKIVAFVLYFETISNILYNFIKIRYYLTIINNFVNILIIIVIILVRIKSCNNKEIK